MKKYRVILADPLWDYRNGGNGRHRMDHMNDEYDEYDDEEDFDFQEELRRGCFRIYEIRPLAPMTWLLYTGRACPICETVNATWQAAVCQKPGEDWSKFRTGSCNQCGCEFWADYGSPMRFYYNPMTAGKKTAVSGRLRPASASHLPQLHQQRIAEAVAVMRWIDRQPIKVSIPLGELRPLSPR